MLFSLPLSRASPLPHSTAFFLKNTVKCGSGLAREWERRLVSGLARMVIKRNNLGLANPVTVDLAQVLDRFLHAIPGQADVVDRDELVLVIDQLSVCLLYTSPSPRDGLLSRMPSSA